MFKLLRYYSVASLIAILATAVLLIWFYRQVAIQGIVQLAERSNMNLAQIAMDPIKPALLEFLGTAADLRPGSASLPLPTELARSIKILMQDRFIVKIKIYNRQGVVAFSTKPVEVGTDRSDNQGVIAAMHGGVGNALVYRDTFNSFDGVTETDNLMQTYLPVRAGPADPIQGVFELYADVNNLVHQTERTEFIIMAGAILILSALYAVLIVIVRRANHIIGLQQRTIRERTETLEILSAHMLKSEESHKKKIAFDLHEGLAQTLSAAKLLVENGQNHRVCNAVAAGECVGSIIPVLQEAIQEVRTIATDLWPSSLDDLGLLPTINWFCREFEGQHPGIRIERQISLQEGDIPTPLKVILYRIVVSVLDDMALHTNTGRVHIALSLDDHALVLRINDTASEALSGTATPLTRLKSQLRAGFDRMEELATLSGGDFTASRHSSGGTTLRAAWHR